ncbi:MAG: hypothetical protein HY393_00180 [Candidatus Diapherotrites archaeon]|nr:hypothetical protein [Candidatus Diapherotrites archaeon]
MRHAFQQIKIEYEPSRIIQPGEKYIQFASRETCLARDEVWIKWTLSHGLKGFIDFPSNNLYEYFVEEKSFLDLLEQLLQEIKDTWKSYIQTYEKKRAQVIKSSTALSKSLQKGKKPLTLKKYLEFIRTGEEYSTYIWGPWAVIFHLEKKIIDQFPDELAVIQSLEEPIEFLKMKQDLHLKSIESVQKEYGWLPVYSPHDNPYTKEELLKMKGETKKEEVMEEFKGFKRNKKAFQKLLKKIKDPEIRKEVEIVHAFAFLKTDRVDAWKKAMHIQRPFYQHLATRMGWEIEEAVNLFNEEIIAFLESEKLPERIKITLRSQNKPLYYFTSGQVTVVESPALIEQTRSTLHPANESITQFSGITGCMGKTTGIVRVIHTPKDVEKIKQGDIFVARFTFPSFTPKMIISKAIVTDEGGITNHAAIISREYNLPCIVNTKIATSILQDGDLVEVNADQGIVRILQRNQQKSR